VTRKCRKFLPERSRVNAGLCRSKVDFEELETEQRNTLEKL
jgi:hypothetical protein